MSDELILLRKRVSLEANEIFKEINSFCTDSRVIALMNEFQKSMDSLVEDLLGNLPEEVLLIIIGHCASVYDFTALTRTCRRFHHIIVRGDALWKNLCIKLWSQNDFPFSASRLIWAIETLKEVSWVWIAKCLSNNTGEGTSFSMGGKCVYIGKMSNGILIGDKGIVIDDTIVDFGIFCRTSKTGIGRRIWSDGDQYIGEFKDDTRHGIGIYSFSNGGKYCGMYKKNEKDGHGTYFEMF